MKCPECGSEMEKGVLSANGYIVWSEKPLWTVFSGEELPTKGIPKPRHMDGFRCPACRLVIAHYLELEKPNGYPVNLTGATYQSP